MKMIPDIRFGAQNARVGLSNVPHRSSTYILEWDTAEKERWRGPLRLLACTFLYEPHLPAQTIDSVAS